ncbi:hypothetical protein ROLI_027500 [Roseobacter fucihabitans]|uniref:Uncharacterized protein n=1 Tax=Roseobacter fucihabitans TaxID=1537242 RepID=A0ABZ2BUI6_9RHOB|nr:hypothetical protein [Roseobacter litoralis]
MGAFGIRHLSQMCCAGSRQLLGRLAIVVADYEVFFRARQFCEQSFINQFQSFAFGPKAKSPTIQSESFGPTFAPKFFIRTASICAADVNGWLQCLMMLS